MRVSASASTAVVSPSTNNLFADSSSRVCDNASSTATSPRIGSFHSLTDNPAQNGSNTRRLRDGFVSVSRATVSQLQNTERKIVSRSVDLGYFLRSQYTSLMTAETTNNAIKACAAVRSLKPISLRASLVAKDVCKFDSLVFSHNNISFMTLLLSLQGLSHGISRKKNAASRTQLRHW
jgi:hypothetical protein